MSGKPSTHVKEWQALFRKRTWLRISVLLGFGGMVVALLCLLSGCGSDSKPEAVSKKEKTAAGPNVVKTPGALPTGLRGGGAIKREPNGADQLEITAGSGLTAEKIQKTWAAGLKQIESPNSEVAPGMTKQQMEAKIATAQQKAQKIHESPNSEVAPGMTKQQMEAKIATAQQKAQKMLQSPNAEKSQGITKAEMEDRVNAALRKVASQREVAPGITRGELEDRVEAARRKVESRRVVVPGSVED